MQRCSIDLPQRICGYLFRKLLQNILPQVAVWAALRNNFSSTTTCCTRKKICVLRRIYDYMRQLIRQSGYVLRYECSCLDEIECRHSPLSVRMVVPSGNFFDSTQTY